MAVRHEKHGGDHHVRPHVTHRHDTEKPRCIHTDNRREFTSRKYVDYRDSAGICPVYTARAKPQQNAVVESAICRVIEGGHATRHEIRWLFPGVDLATFPNIGVDGNRLRHEAALCAADWFNRFATKGDTGSWSPQKVFLPPLPEMQVMPFVLEGMMRVDYRSTTFNPFPVFFSR